MDFLHLLRKIRSSSVGRVINIPRRFLKAMPFAIRPFIHIIRWTFSSKEDTNFSYELHSSNIRHLSHAIAAALNVSPAEALFYINEAQQDKALKRHVIDAVLQGPHRSYSDASANFAKRLGWYAVVRLLKPNLVVETGVDKGLGSVVICAALRRNGSGRYLGTDIDPSAGFLLTPPYSEVGEILYGDSLESLRKIDAQVDLFINDSDHSPNYEAREYELIHEKLSENSIILGDNSHATDELMNWSEKVGRKFIFWPERPINHWYPGGGIGFSFIS